MCGVFASYTQNATRPAHGGLRSLITGQKKDHRARKDHGSRRATGWEGGKQPKRTLTVLNPKPNPETKTPPHAKRNPRNRGRKKRGEGGGGRREGGGGRGGVAADSWCCNRAQTLGPSPNPVARDD